MGEREDGFGLEGEERRVEVEDESGRWDEEYLDAAEAGTVDERHLRHPFLPAVAPLLHSTVSALAYSILLGPLLHP